MTLRFDNDCVNKRVLSIKFMYTKEKYYIREINILKELSVTGRLCEESSIQPLGTCTGYLHHHCARGIKVRMLDSKINPSLQITCLEGQVRYCSVSVYITSSPYS